MAITNGYLTLEEFDSYLAAANNGVTIGTGNRAVEIENAVTAASRMIDQHCGRIFYDAGTASRVLKAGSAVCVELWADAHDITAVKTDTTGDGTFDTTWTAADYQLEPLNGVVSGQPGWPTTRIRAVGDYRFPVDVQARVEISGSWGWAAVPADVKQACFIQSHRLFTRSESPTGVAGVGDFGAVRLTSVDRDVETLLRPYRNII